ncbi:MAG: TIM44-like domain-containing protein [Syntrophales bacterium]|nr:TIM44-like domain-containing protein [Syntrophales bacterium]MDD5232965.1 TIM44-like domain-containing protein [Syntrophales bacterium]
MDEDDREKGIGHIRQMDSGFSDIKFKEDRTDDFFRIQGAWADRDMSSVRQLLTEEMFDVFQGEAERSFPAAKRIPSSSRNTGLSRGRWGITPGSCPR